MYNILQKNVNKYLSFSKLGDNDAKIVLNTLQFVIKNCRISMRVKNVKKKTDDCNNMGSFICEKRVLVIKVPSFFG